MLDFPSDILLRIFDELPALPCIIRSSQVSQAWRRLAHGHPKFSRDIRFRNLEERRPSNGAADLLTARVMAGTGIVNLDLHVSQASDFVDTALLPLVSQSMSRVVDLCVIVPPSCAAELVAAVGYPAPLLESLRLDVHGDFETTRLELSANFLGGLAPRLAAFHTRGFERAAGAPVVPALSSVKTLHYGPLHHLPSRPCSFLMDMIEALPRLECLRVEGLKWAGSWGDFSLRPPPHTVELYSTHPLLPEMLNALSTSETKTLITTGPLLREEGFAFVTAHLTGPLALEMELNGNAGTYCVRLKDSRGHVRQMNYVDISYAGYWESEIPGNLARVFPPLVGRITRIAVRSDLWDSMLVLAPGFPAVTHVTVYVDSASAAGGGDALAPVACPALGVLEISSSNRRSVSALWLAGLLGHTLGSLARRRLSLVLRGCNLEGDPNLIWGYLADMSLVPS